MVVHIRARSTPCTDMCLHAYILIMSAVMRHAGICACHLNETLVLLILFSASKSHKTTGHGSHDHSPAQRAITCMCTFAYVCTCHMAKPYESSHTEARMRQCGSAAKPQYIFEPYIFSTMSDACKVGLRQGMHSQVSEKHVLSRRVAVW
jgi:hypothetical protein